MLIKDHGDIKAWRDNNGAQTNVPHLILHHSPTGFEWGYGGSGPADFALNILYLFTDKETAWNLHQQFKWEFIARMPYEGGEIKAETIREWIKSAKQ